MHPSLRAFPFLLLLLAASAQKTPPSAAARRPIAAGVPRAECFPADRLPADLRAKSEEMLLKALDAKALFTLAGGLKPMRSVGSTFTLPVDQTDGGPERSNFVWTVPKGHQENDQDRAVTSRAARILAAYAERRPRDIGPGKPGAFAPLSDWYCGPDGRCTVENVRVNPRSPIPEESRSR